MQTGKRHASRHVMGDLIGVKGKAGHAWPTSLMLCSSERCLGPEGVAHSAATFIHGMETCAIPRAERSGRARQAWCTSRRCSAGRVCATRV